MFSKKGLICASALLVLAISLAFGAPYFGAFQRSWAISSKVRTYEAGVRARLEPVLKRKNYSYPLERFTLLVIKDVSQLQLFAHSSSGDAIHLKDYPILAKSGRLGPKLREGDRQIPEGIYKVTLLNPKSSYHLSLRLDYPNEFDREMAQRDGRTQLGGDIMIHGKKRIRRLCCDWRSGY
jgi:murein L,D-transpeptidase YafK